VTTDLVDINLNMRILLGSSYYEGWQNQETFVRKDPLGNDVDQNHPWNQTTIPRPQKRSFGGNYSWVMSPRWLHKGEHLALAIERDRARTYFQAYCAAAAYYFLEKAFAEVQAGRTETWTEVKVPDEAIGCGFHEAVQGVLSHHLVIRDGKIANYHPYPPTPWNANPRDIYGTPGPYEDAVQDTPIFEENGPDNFKGIDIMRTVRRTLETVHSPMFGARHANT
jgi:hydrogenase large subunit